MNAPFLNIGRPAADRIAHPGSGAATIALIVPVHNEEGAIAPFLK
ncbi:MAG: glycosyltransferase, partial [Mesorhizobium sp.]